MPDLVMKMVTACNDPSMNAKGLCEIIECDPAIALRLLRIANSSAYGLSRSVSNLKHAVVILGLKAVRNLVLSVATRDVFDPGEGGFRKQLWDHSLGCAAVSTLLAKEKKVFQDDAFLAGMVHDTGKLVLLEAYGEEYTKVTSTVLIDDRIRVEREAYGVDHQEIGERCGREWKLPDQISTAIGKHHDAGDCDSPIELVDIVRLANGLTRYWGLGDEQTVELDIDTLLAQSPLKVQPTDLDELKEKAVEGYQSLVESFES